VGETERLTLREAAAVAGIPLDAFRKRVYRGSIPATKVDGQYVVLASDAQALAVAAERPGETTGETVLGHVSDTGETTANPLAADYIASLKGEIDYLRSELSKAIDQAAAERERADVLHREALQRIEALTAGPSPTDPYVSPSEAPGREPPREGPETPQHPPSWPATWLRRLLGRP
jgi:hypothetical protein